ncbi:MAG: hypothetical protein Q8L98_08165 [Chlamydiales bacterium]|nr:hypothetical protein [Chlamydiales bacterium]
MSSISSTNPVSSSSSSMTHVESGTNEQKNRRKAMYLAKGIRPANANSNSSSAQQNNSPSKPLADKKVFLIEETQLKELSGSGDQRVVQIASSSLDSPRENVSKRSFLGSSIDSTNSLHTSAREKSGREPLLERSPYPRAPLQRNDQLAAEISSPSLYSPRENVSKQRSSESSIDLTNSLYVSEDENPFKMQYRGLFTELKNLIEGLEPDLRYALLQRFANVRFIDPEHHTIPLAGIPCKQRMASCVKELNHGAKDYVLGSQKHRAQKAEQVVHAFNEFARECGTHSLEYVSFVRQVVDLGQACLSRKIEDIKQAREVVLESKEAKNFLPEETICELKVTSAKAVLMRLQANFKSACAEAAWKEAEDFFFDITNLPTELRLSEEEMPEPNSPFIKIYEEAFVSHFRTLFATDSLEEIEKMFDIIRSFEGITRFLPNEGASLFAECRGCFVSYFKKLCLYGSPKQVKTAFGFIQRFQEDRLFPGEEKYFPICRDSFVRYFERVCLDASPKKFEEACDVIQNLERQKGRELLTKCRGCFYVSFGKLCSTLPIEEINLYFRIFEKKNKFPVLMKRALFQACSNGIRPHFHHLCYKIVLEGSSAIEPAFSYYKEIKRLRYSSAGCPDLLGEFLEFYLNAGLCHFQKLCPESIEASLDFFYTFARCSDYPPTLMSFDLWFRSCLLALFSSDKVFGNAKLETFIHERIEEPPLPENIFELIYSPCPIDNNNKVIASHKLILVPNIAQDWKAMAQKFKRDSDLCATPWSSPHPKETFCSPSKASPIKHSYWILTLRTTTNEKCPQGYRPPSQLEGAVLAGVYSCLDPAKTYKCFHTQDDIYFEISEISRDQGSARAKLSVRFFVRDLNNGEQVAAD